MKPIETARRRAIVPEVGVGLLVGPRGGLAAPVPSLPEPAAVAAGAVDLLVALAAAQVQRVRVQLALAVEALGAPVAVVPAPVAHLRVARLRRCSLCEPNGIGAKNAFKDEPMTK